MAAAHWSSPDPAEFRGSDQAAHDDFAAVASQIQRRIERMGCLPLETLDRVRRERLTREIGTRSSCRGIPDF